MLRNRDRASDLPKPPMGHEYLMSHREALGLIGSALYPGAWPSPPSAWPEVWRRTWYRYVSPRLNENALYLEEEQALIGALRERNTELACENPGGPLSADGRAMAMFGRAHTVLSDLVVRRLVRCFGLQERPGGRRGEPFELALSRQGRDIEPSLFDNHHLVLGTDPLPLFGDSILVTPRPGDPFQPGHATLWFHRKDVEEQAEHSARERWVNSETSPDIPPTGKQQPELLSTEQAQAFAETVALIAERFKNVTPQPRAKAGGYIPERGIREAVTQELVKAELSYITERLREAKTSPEHDAQVQPPLPATSPEQTSPKLSAKDRLPNAPRTPRGWKAQMIHDCRVLIHDEDALLQSPKGTLKPLRGLWNELKEHSPSIPNCGTYAPKLKKPIGRNEKVTINDENIPWWKVQQLYTEMNQRKGQGALVWTLPDAIAD